MEAALACEGRGLFRSSHWDDKHTAQYSLYLAPPDTWGLFNTTAQAPEQLSVLSRNRDSTYLKQNP